MPSTFLDFFLFPLFLLRDASLFALFFFSHSFPLHVQGKKRKENCLLQLSSSSFDYILR